MLQGLINQCKRRIKQLEARMEDETLTPDEAKKLREAYETEHWLLSELTGDKGDKKPE